MNTVSKPNLLVIVPDGMQAGVLEPESQCRTPHFDALARRGVSMTRAHAPAATCSPARASLMTGMMPHNHGVLQVEHCVDHDQCVLRDRYRHWAQCLVENGYRTAYFGKWHIERTFELERYGWQINAHTHGGNPICEEAWKRFGIEDTPPAKCDPMFTHYAPGAEGYPPQIHYGVVDVPPEKRDISVPIHLANEFLDTAGNDGHPWACVVSFFAPNEGMIASRQTFESYDVDTIELPPNLHDPLTDAPAVYRRSQGVMSGITERQWKEARACYYSRITELDALIGALFRKLEQRGQMENTIVVLTTDHGKYVGAHGMDAHNFGAFEEIYNIPMVLAGPGIACGVESDTFVSLHDLAVTLPRLCGVPAMPDTDGRAFDEVLADPAANHETRTGFAESFGNRFIYAQRVLWDGDWKFVFNGFDEDELYNHAEDPHELCNRAADPECLSIKKSMMREIWQELRRTGDKTLLNSGYYGLRFACIGPDAPTHS